MKRKHILLTIAGLAAGLSLLLAGCCDSQHAVDQIQDDPPEVYQQNISNNHHMQHGSVHRVSSLHRHEHAVTDVSSDTGTAPSEYIPQTTDEITQPTTIPVESGQENRPSNSGISLDRAIEIANADLASRGISATYRSNSGIDWERGQRVWELLFVTNGAHMPFIEYYINADNGNIVKFEWDD